MELQAVRVAGGGDSGRPRSPEVFMGAKDLEKAVTEHVDAEAEEFLEEGWDEARAVRSPPCIVLPIEYHGQMKGLNIVW